MSGKCELELWREKSVEIQDRLRTDAAMRVATFWSRTDKLTPNQIADCLRWFHNETLAADDIQKLWAWIDGLYGKIQEMSDGLEDRLTVENFVLAERLSEAKQEIHDLNILVEGAAFREKNNTVIRTRLHKQIDELKKLTQPVAHHSV